MSPVDAVRTERLVGRALDREHLDELLALSQDPRVMATLRGVWTVEKTETVLAQEMAHWREHGFGLWGLRLADGIAGEPRFVGRAGLRRRIFDGAEEVALSYALHAEHWGRGLATEFSKAACELAFGVLGLDDLVAVVLPANRASQRVMEKAGFAFDKDVVHHGMPHRLYRQRASPERRS